MLRRLLVILFSVGFLSMGGICRAACLQAEPVEGPIDASYHGCCADLEPERAPCCPIEREGDESPRCWMCGVAPHVLPWPKAEHPTSETAGVTFELPRAWMVPEAPEPASLHRCGAPPLGLRPVLDRICIRTI